MASSVRGNANALENFDPKAFQEIDTVDRQKALIGFAVGGTALAAGLSLWQAFGIGVAATGLAAMSMGIAIAVIAAVAIGILVYCRVAHKAADKDQTKMQILKNKTIELKTFGEKKTKELERKAEVEKRRKSRNFVSRAYHGVRNS